MKLFGWYWVFVTDWENWHWIEDRQGHKIKTLVAIGCMERFGVTAICFGPFWLGFKKC